MLARSRLWLVVTWEGDVEHVASLTRGQCFSLGAGPLDWPFPTRLLGTRSRPIADYRGDTPKICQPSGDWQDFTPGQTGVWEFGPFRILVTLGNADGHSGGFCHPSPDLAPLPYWLGSATALLSLVGVMVYATPELTAIEPLPLRQSYVVESTMQRDAVAEPEADDEPPGIALEKLPYAERIPGIPMKCGGYSAMGNPRAIALGRYGVTGPKDNPDPHLSRLLVPNRDTAKRQPDPVPTIAIYGGLPNLDLRAPTGPWGRDTSLGTDEVSARGNMWGDEIVDAAGDEDLGTKYLDGGLLKRIEVERTIASKESRPARVIHTQLSVQGSLPPLDVETAVATRLAEFRDCYRADPSSHGTYEAHVELGFEVTAAGALAEVKALRNELVGAPLLGCILDRARKLTFPAEGGASKITYPLHFVPSVGEASPPVRTIALAPEIHRETEPPAPCSGKRSSHRVEKPKPCPG